MSLANLQLIFEFIMSLSELHTQISIVIAAAASTTPLSSHTPRHAYGIPLRMCFDMHICVCIYLFVRIACQNDAAHLPWWLWSYWHSAAPLSLCRSLIDCIPMHILCALCHYFPSLYRSPFYCMSIWIPLSFHRICYFTRVVQCTLLSPVFASYLSAHTFTE